MRALIAILILSVLSTVNSPALAKKWTVYDRQVELRKRVKQGYKANELTEKETKSLNERLDKVTEEANKMTTKNGGKLSYKDEGKLEKRLNNVSLDIQKFKLKKRVTVH